MKPRARFLHAFAFNFHALGFTRSSKFLRITVVAKLAPKHVIFVIASGYQTHTITSYFSYYFLDFDCFFNVSGLLMTLVNVKKFI